MPAESPGEKCGSCVLSLLGGFGECFPKSHWLDGEFTHGLPRTSQAGSSSRAAFVHALSQSAIPDTRK